MTKVQQALQHGTQQLSSTDSTARLDAEVLLSHVLKKNRTYLYTHADSELTPAQWHHYSELIKQRRTGIPIAYLIGYREFWSLKLRVSPATLIPRPETEQLVELALAAFTDKQPKRILDLGTGSGAIALAIASERPDWQIVATDNSRDALAIATSNALEHHLSNIQFVHSDWYTALSPSLFDMIVTNPPYIVAGDPHLSALRYEPYQALVSQGDEGLDAIQHIVEHSRTYLSPQGVIFIEHGADQGMAVTALLKAAGFKSVQCWKDLQGLDRITGGYCS